MKKWIAVMALVPVLAAPAALADTGDPEAGAQKTVVCGACHGMNGNSVNPEWPSLAGQHPRYTLQQIQAYQSGQRQKDRGNKDRGNEDRCGVPAQAYSPVAHA